MDPKTAILADPVFAEHLEGVSHPERPERLQAALRGIAAAGSPERILRICARPASKDELLLCHTPRYLEIAQADVESGRPRLSTGDTDISPESWRVAVHAVGGVLEAVGAVMEGRARNAFCAVRPPGHHASAGRGMGFCLLNNVALAARFAQRKYGAGRVLIVDWDVHHGNGTQDIFYEDPSVFFFSTHQWPLYPGTGRRDETGEGAGEGTTMNFPLPAGSGRDEILGAVREWLVPAADLFRPDLVLISSGFDSRAGDLLGRFNLTDDDFAELTAVMMEIAGRYAEGRLVSVLEGGYSLEGLASATAAHVRSLLTDGGRAPEPG